MDILKVGTYNTCCDGMELSQYGWHVWGSLNVYGIPPKNHFSASVHGVLWLYTKVQYTGVGLWEVPWDR
jgi:hypothetical protein